MTIAEAAAFFRDGDRFCIVTHRSPDGDTTGCASALCRGLRALGKTAAVLENPQTTPRYAPWLEGLTVPREGAGDTVVTVDVAAETLLPENAEHLTVALAIDHHGSNTGFAQQTLLDPGKAACGEIVFALLQELGAPLDPVSAGALYVAVSTDTGCFQYSNTTANTLRVAAALRDAGVDAAAINRALFGVKSLRRLRLEARLTESTVFWAGGRVAVCVLPLSWREELALTEDDLDALASFPRAIEGVEAGVLLKEKPDGVVKLSLRTGPSINASAVCARLGGGGHPAAAGASFKAALGEALELVRAAFAGEGVEV